MVYHTGYLGSSVLPSVAPSHGYYNVNGPSATQSTGTGVGHTIMSRAKGWLSSLSNALGYSAAAHPNWGHSMYLHDIGSVPDVVTVQPGRVPETRYPEEGEGGGHRIGVTTDIIDGATEYTAENSNYKPKIPEYGGAEDWEDYILMFNTAAKLANWDDQRCVAELWSRLTGEARQVCAGLSRQPGEMTFQKLTEALRDRFVGDREQYWISLQNARRQQDESLDQLADRLRKLFVRAYPAKSLDQAEGELGYLFYAALCENNQLTDQIYAERNSALVSVLQAAKQYELHRKVMEQLIQTTNTTGIANNGTEEGENIPHMQEGIDRGRAIVRGVAYTGLSYRRRSGQLLNEHQSSAHVARCFICNSPQHFQRFCPLNGERPSGRGRGRGSLSRPRGDREGGRGWRGSEQPEEGLGQWPTPENTIQEEN